MLNHQSLVSFATEDDKTQSLFYHKSVEESVKWKLLSKNEVKPRTSHASSGIHGTPHFYVVGGSDGTFCEPLVDQFFISFDYEKGVWKDLTSTIHNSTATSGDTLSPLGASAANNAHIFDPQSSSSPTSSSQTTTTTSSDFLTPRIGHSMVGLLDGRIIGSQVPLRLDTLSQQQTQVRHSALLVFGGWTDNATTTNELWKFNVLTNTWHNLTSVQYGSIPPVRSNHSCVLIDDQMIVFGGLGQNPDDLLCDTFILDLNTLEWTSVTYLGTEGVDYPHKSRSHACAVHRKRMVLFGGGSDKVCYNDLWVFDLLVKRWIKVEPQEPRLFKEVKKKQAERRQLHSYALSWLSELGIPPTAVFKQPEPRLFSVGVVTDVDQFFVFGGRNGKQKINETWRFDFESHEWTLLQFGDMSEIKQIIAPEPEEEDENDPAPAPKIKPSPRSGCSISTITKSDGSTKILMFAGAEANKKSSELWELKVQPDQTRNNLFRVLERKTFSDIDIITC